MVSELWFSRLGGQLWAAAAEQGRIVELHHEWPERGAVSLGAIYLAKVSRIVPQLGAAFVTLGSGCEGYLESPGEQLSRLRAGETLLVQVRREAFAGKRAKVSAALEIGGTHLILRPGSSGCSVSRRIEHDAERKRLSAWAAAAASAAGGRLQVRTASSGVGEDLLQRELDSLKTRAAGWAETASRKTAPCLIAAAPGRVDRLVRDFAGRGLQRVVVETSADLTAASDALGAEDSRIEHYCDTQPLIHRAGIWSTAQQALSTRTHLTSGASLAFESTEALWAVDVNAAAVRGTTAERAARTINGEAAVTIAAEIRLRDIAGTILIDFLDLKNGAQREEVAERFRMALRPDRRYLRVSGWTSLGLCELARRREGPGLLERLGEPHAPTPWGRAAQILAAIPGERGIAPRRRVAAVDEASAHALRASIESSETPIELDIEIKV